MMALVCNPVLSTTECNICNCSCVKFDVKVRNVCNQSKIAIFAKVLDAQKKVHAVVCKIVTVNQMGKAKCECVDHTETFDNVIIDVCCPDVRGWTVETCCNYICNPCCCRPPQTCIDRADSETEPEPETETVPEPTPQE